MIILGIDPGIARTGWCVLDVPDGKYDGKSDRGRYDLRSPGIGCIETVGDSSDNPSPLVARLKILGENLQSLIVKWRPASMAIEELFFLKKSPSALSVAEARGVLLFVAAKEGVPVFEYNPRSVKTSLTGSGAADKNQMQKMVQRILNLPAIPTPDDAADAAAIALCHYFTNVRRAGMR